ncbi:MAG TPA: hypothetical protein PLR71_00530 [Deltaproteobacteria bacterium]|nr:hypothetical protein [Deltaproteobacteria bacterium]HQI80016.1 hypothetical protein [Deltaproteobacteria bacterium]
MRLLWPCICLMLLLPADIHAARVVVAVPQGISEVRLLSAGTAAVLDLLRERLQIQLKDSSERTQVDRLEREVAQATAAITSAEKAYADQIEALRKQYIRDISLTIHSADDQITPESALGEIAFVYTVHNGSNRIISDITYKPQVGALNLPITSSLVMEFLNPRTLIYGLGPGESLSNQGGDPERFSFFLSELKGNEIKQIKASMPAGFSIQITDIHFVSQKGYKGQSKIMDVSEAFAGQLWAYRSAAQEARDSHTRKTEALARAKKVFASETKGSLDEFRSRSSDLKTTSVRYRASVKPKKLTATMDPVVPGKYFVYAPATRGKAAFQEVSVTRGTTKLTIETLKKDPFEP